MLRLPRTSKFESRAVEGVLLECLEFGVYKVLVDVNNGHPRVIESGNVTFHDSQFPGAPGMTQFRFEKDVSDSDLEYEVEDKHQP